MSGSRRLGVWVALFLAAGCEPPPKPKPLEDNSLKLAPVVQEKAPTKAKAPPTFEVDESSPKVAYSRFLVDRPDGKSKFDAELEAQREHIAGKRIELKIARAAKLAWVTAMLSGLEKQGATGFQITTETRTEYPSTLSFETEASGKSAPTCSTVTMIQEDRSTATWKSSGGTARRRGRGLGGPDLSTTGKTIESVAQSCKASDTLFLTAHEVVEWGLLYDLAASTTKLEKKTFKQRIIVGSAVPGKAR